MQGWEREIGLKVAKTALAVKTLTAPVPEKSPGELPLGSPQGSTGGGQKQETESLAEFRDALIRVARDRNENEIDTDRLGKWLRKCKRRIVAGRRFVNIAPAGSVARWQLESVPGADAGLAG
jgi:hypothetical protein